jgi:uncharacterized YigZ family protein
MSYPVPEKTVSTEFEVKKSRFIAQVCFADSRHLAMNFLARIKHNHPDARHHCWAYLLGNPESPLSAAMSDDGEPSGTAGKPILNVLQHKGVGDIMVVVTRYFGGIKLGAGGLVRAYSAATQQVMAALPLRQQQASTEQIIDCHFQHEHAIRHWLENHQASNIKVAYISGNNGRSVRLQLVLPEIHCQTLLDFIAGCDAVIHQKPAFPDERASLS